MRAELMIDNQSKGKFEFVVAPRSGDTITLKEETATVQEFCHNLDQNRLVVLCTMPSKTPKTSGTTQQPRHRPLTPDIKEP